MPHLRSLLADPSTSALLRRAAVLLLGTLLPLHTHYFPLSVNSGIARNIKATNDIKPQYDSDKTKHLSVVAEGSDDPVLKIQVTTPNGGIVSDEAWKTN